jgi:ATP-dependent RNA helicase SUPV3L1/SUV3
VQAPALLAAQPLAVRAALCRAHAGDGGFVPPTPRQASLRLPRAAAPRLYVACGFPPYGPRAVRGDLVERIHRATGEAGAAGQGTLARKVARWLACPPREAADVLEAIAEG